MQSPAIVRSDSTEKKSAAYRKDFSLWSQSQFGFWVLTHYDLAKKSWINGRHPVVWSESQIRAFHILLDMDAHGQPPFNEVIWIDIGQTGKTFANAAICQWFGMFHEYDSDIQIIANSKEQSQRRVYNKLQTSVTTHPYSKHIADVREKDILFTQTLNRAIPIPKNFATQAGGSPVLRSIDEWCNWTEENDDHVMAELKATPARNISMLWVSSYTGFADDIGPMNAVLNTMFDENDMPLAHVVQVEDDLPLYTHGKTAIWWNHDNKRYPWVTDQWLADERNKATMTDAHYARIWQTHRPEREDAFMPIKAWDACEDEEWSPISNLDRGIAMCIGVDIGIKNDSSACVARAYNPETGYYELLTHRIWESREFSMDKGGVIGVIKQWILDLHRRHNVRGVFYDPSQFQGAANDLENDGVKMVEVSQNSDRTVADTQYRALIMGGELRNYPQSQDLRDHVLHAVGVENRNGAIRLDKKKARLKIDAAVADSQACYGVTLLKQDFIRLRRKKESRPAPERRLSPFKRTFSLRQEGRWQSEK